MNALMAVGFGDLPGDQGCTARFVLTLAYPGSCRLTPANSGSCRLIQLAGPVAKLRLRAVGSDIYRGSYPEIPANGISITPAKAWAA
ncbi:MAG: hypothetical protein KGM95_04315 [Betaproteobacteria bacterium]|nr:hypothetical protein [Betaproteobacteria bacterium]